MRFLALGLMAAALAAATAPGSAFAADKKPAAAPAYGDAKSHAQGMAEAPPLIQQTGISCTPADANVLTGKTVEGGKSTTTKVYELACQQSLGWMIFLPEGGTPSAVDCITLSSRKPKPGEADKGQTYCRLPQNADPAATLGPVLAQGGVANCTPNQGRYIGSTSDLKLDQYEAGCPDGHAYIVQLPRTGGTYKLQVTDCMKQDPGYCQFFTSQTYLAQLTRMAQPANRPCQMTNGRYVGTAPDGHVYYEVACSDAKSGYMLETDATGNYVKSVDCGKATNVGGGCQLTSASAAQTAENGVYTKAAKAIGFDCDVSSYHSFGTDTKTGREVVELACTGHPESYLALLPVDKGQQGAYMNCVRANGIGLKCALSPIEATYSKIGSDISKAGKSCQVSNGRDIGSTKEGDDYVEVTCTGGPGMVVAYAQSTDAAKSTQTCAAAKATGLTCSLK